MDNKKLIKLALIVSVFVLAIGAAGAWWYYTDKKTREIAVEKREKAKDSFKALNLSGDVEKGTDYVSLLDSNNKDEALDVYFKAIDGASTKEEKIAIIDDLISIAGQKQQPNHMLSAAKRRVEIDPSVESYYLLSLARSANEDYAGRVDALEHLMAVFDTQYPVPHDERQQELRSSYESELTNAREVLRLRKLSEGGE